MEDKFYEFLEMNPFRGMKYPNVEDLSNFNKKIGAKLRFLVPKWLSGKDEDYYTSSGCLTHLLNSLGFNSQIYYDIMILGITDISDRPRCPITNEYTKFLRLSLGYNKYFDLKSFSKSLSLDTPEAKIRGEKISKFMKGKKYSLGIKRSEETRKRMSLAQKGHGCTETARRNMSLAHLGKSGSRKGIPHSPETRELLSRRALERIDRDPDWIDTFVKMGYQKTNKGYYLSNKYLGNDKTGKWFYYMSNFELILLEYCDRTDSIEYIDKCPIIKYEFNNKEKRHIPDLFIKFVTGESCIIELKPKYRVKDEIVIAKKNSCIKYCNENNISYSIITEDEISLIKDNKFSLLDFVKQGVKY